MSTAAGAMFSCSMCKKQYRWKPEFAGKKVKCKCGNVMHAPADPPGAEAQKEESLYGLAGEEDKPKASAGKTPATKAGPVSDGGFRCPSCANPLTPGAVLCTNCGFNLKTKQKMAGAMAAAAPAVAGVKTARVATPMAMPAAAGGPAPARTSNPMLGYASMAKKNSEAEAAAQTNAIQDLYAPAVLVVVGLIASFFESTRFGVFTVSAGGAFVKIGIELVIGFFLTGVGCLAAIKMMDIAFGAPGPAALKLTAIVIFPAPVAAIIGYLMHDTSGFMAWALGMIFFLALFKFLFDLDLGEILLLSCILTIVRMWLGALLAGMLIALVLNGAGGGASLGSMSSAQVNTDRMVQQEIDLGRAVDAKAWLDEIANHVFLHVGHDTPIVKAFLDAGAKATYVTKEGPEADALIIELPRDKASRAKLFQIESQYVIKNGLGKPSKDNGQKFIVIEY